jgi:radical SAM protein with 4Fe4S-binding SPASM domain
MKNQSAGHFYARIHNKKRHFPLTGLLELTYRCNLDCIHCYCKGSEDKDRELSTRDWIKILEVLRKEGCIWLVLTGGEPLIRDDFLEIYSCARKKGFIISLFTNGLGLRDEIVDYLAEFPPFSIEITLNGITRDTYESISQIKGSFAKVIRNIRLAAAKKLPLLLKTNCLKQNKHQVGEIKAFCDKLLGKPSKNKYFYRYDPMIYPRLNGDKTPCQYRLSFREMIEVQKQDVDIWREYQEGLHVDLPDLERNRDFLYRCNSWMTRFIINPYGRLKFCGFSDKFSVDLKTASFKEGFYNVFPKLLNEKFKTHSKCRDCKLRPICYQCPARAFLETGDEEAPVEYYCELARKTRYYPAMNS